MWEKTSDGVCKTFETKSKETVVVEIKTRDGVAVIHRGSYDQTICGMRNNEVKIWNDLLFDPVSYHQIKTQMEALCVKKESASSKGASKRR